MGERIVEGERDHARARQLLLERFRRIPVIGLPLAALMRWVSRPSRIRDVGGVKR